MFAMSTCAVIHSVSAWQDNGGGDFDQVAEADANDPQGYLSFVPLWTGTYHFFVEFAENIWQDGAFRLYQIGPG